LAVRYRQPPFAPPPVHARHVLIAASKDNWHLAASDPRYARRWRHRAVASSRKEVLFVRFMSLEFTSGVADRASSPSRSNIDGRYGVTPSEGPGLRSSPLVPLLLLSSRCRHVCFSAQFLFTVPAGVNDALTRSGFLKSLRIHPPSRALSNSPVLGKFLFLLAVRRKLARFCSLQAAGFSIERFPAYSGATSLDPKVTRGEKRLTPRRHLRWRIREKEARGEPRPSALSQALSSRVTLDWYG